MSGTMHSRFSMILLGAVLMAMLFAVGCSDHAIVDQPDNSSQPRLLQRSAKAVSSPMACRQGSRLLPEKNPTLT